MSTEISCSACKTTFIHMQENYTRPLSCEWTNYFYRQCKWMQLWINIGLQEGSSTPSMTSPGKHFVKLWRCTILQTKWNAVNKHVLNTLTGCYMLFLIPYKCNILIANCFGIFSWWSSWSQQTLSYRMKFKTLWQR